MCFSIFKKQRKLRFKIQYFNRSLFFFIGFLVLLNINLMAQGFIDISPKRIVFEGQKRIMEVYLTNPGKDSAKYSIEFVQLRMTEDGEFQEINSPDSDQNFADKNIRFFPRSVILGPSESQVVRLQLIKIDQLRPGEYRSHLYFKSMASLKALGEEDIKKDSTLTIKFDPTFGITIPVIIRVGESTTILNITDLKLESNAEGKNKLNLNINRSGNMSVYGDFSIFHIALNGKETRIGFIKGIAVYAPNSLRKLSLDLEDKINVDLKRGKIRVLFSSQSETRPEKFAEAELSL